MAVADFIRGVKICFCCKRELSLEMFDKDNSRPDKLCYQCKECKRAYSRAYYKTEKHQKFRKNYNKLEKKKESDRRYGISEKGKIVKEHLYKQS